MDGTRARAVLGVSEHATQHDLRRAFRAQAKQTHPDAGGDSEAFQTARRALLALQATAPAAPKSDIEAAAAARFQGRSTRADGIDVYDCAPKLVNLQPSNGRLEFSHFLAGAMAQRAAA